MAIELKTISGKLAESFRPALAQNAFDPTQKGYEIVAALQSSLDIHHIIKAFTDMISREFLISGVLYHHDAIDTTVKLGVTANQKSTYNLKVEGADLGSITFMRRKHYSNQTLEKLERLLCNLVYPLRNCIAYSKALQLSQKDHLTGALNRSAMCSAIEREIGLSVRQSKPFSAIMLDIDFFKQVNDNHGHAAGDYVLKTFVQIINDTIRSCDSVFRYGGEEFVIHMSNTDEEGAMLLAERIRLSVESTTMRYNNQSISVTASMGIATLNSLDNSQSLLERADTALYQAKNNGRNQVQAM